MNENENENIVTDPEVFDRVSADTLAVGDQVIVDGEFFIIHSVDSDREDIDEVVIKGENLTDPFNDSLTLYADDMYDLWAM